MQKGNTISFYTAFFILTMNNLAKHIESLLMYHDCVVVPGFGGFIANYVEARTDGADASVLLPPYRSIYFNQLLQSNDGLLVHSYMTCYDASYPDASKQMQSDVDDVKDQLGQNGECDMCGIGKLRQDLYSNITLEPSESGISTPLYYGLGAFTMPSAESLEKEQQLHEAISETTLIPVIPAGDDKKEADKGPVVVKLNRRWIDIAISAAAAVLLFFLISYPSMQDRQDEDVCVASTVRTAPAARHKTHHSEPAPVKTDVAPEAKPEPAEELAPVAAPAPVAEPVSEPQPENRFTIVLATSVMKVNAMEFIEKLKRQGLDEAQFIETGRLNRIIYSSYPTANQAANALNDLRGASPDFAEAWVMELK